MKVMVGIRDHRGGTIMKSLHFIPLSMPFSAALNLILPLRLLGGVSVIKIPSVEFGKRNPVIAAELILVS